MKKLHKRYSQLQLVDRERIGIYQAEGLSIREIAKRLGRSHTTISREIRRNNNVILMMSGYIGNCAHDASKKRKSLANSRLRLKSEEAQSYVKAKLALGWSPEQIANVIFKEMPEFGVSHEAIYQYIYADYREGICFLARKHKKRHLKYQLRKNKCSNIPNRVSILERPNYINERKTFGHWERDSIVSGRSAVTINVLLERKSRASKAATNGIK